MGEENELYDNSGRTIFLPLENEMKRERCLVRSQRDLARARSFNIFSPNFFVCFVN